MSKVSFSTWLKRCLVVVATALAGTASSASAQTAPGFSLTLYADIPDPVRIVFDSAGSLYCGRDTPGDACAPYVVRRIPPGGTTVENYSLTGIPDPDAVAFDATGAISGVPGSIIVGHGCTDALEAVRPDRSVVVVVSNPTLGNPSDMVVDAQGRLVFTSDTSGRLFRYSLAEGLTALTDPANAFGLAQDADGNYYVGSYDGPVRKFSPNGVLLIADYSGDMGQTAAVTVGRGGGFGADVYVTKRTTIGSQTTSELRRYSGPGAYSVIATGFGDVIDMTPGPDGAMYIAQRSPGKVFRLACIQIDQQPPQRTSACPGSTVHLSVSASGAGPLTHRWRKDGEPIDPAANPSAVTSSLVLQDAETVDSGIYDCLIDGVCGSVSTAPSRVTIVQQCGAADLGGPGGIPSDCGDGVLDNNDFVAFVSMFFDGQSRVDFGQQGGLYGADGLLDNNDFIAFIDLFFAGC